MWFEIRQLRVVQELQSRKCLPPQKRSPQNTKEMKNNFLQSLNSSFVPNLLQILLFNPETLKYWVGVQQDQSYHRGRRCLFNLGWPPF